MSQQTSNKTGLKSSVEKQENTRHGRQPMPATQPKEGAFGKESSENSEERGAAKHRKRSALTQGADRIGEESGEDDV